MKQPVRVTAMVIASYPSGDYDKRLILLSRERGRMTVFARGARRKNSSYLAGTQTFAFGEFELYPGKDAYSFQSQPVISNYFDGLSQQFEGIYYGLYFCELAGYVAQEEERSDALLLLLYMALAALEKQKVPARLIMSVYELRLMMLAGLAPQVQTCLYQGREECPEDAGSQLMMEPGELYSFSITGGGLLCSRCRKTPVASYDKRMQLLSGTVYTMRYILSADIKELFSFQVKDEVCRQLEELMQEYISCHLRHEFKSYEVLREVIL